MARTLYAAAPVWAGMRHRFMTLTHANTFARYWGYRVCFLWGLSNGVVHCRFEELLSPVRGVQVINVPERELMELELACRRSKAVRFRGRLLPVYNAGTRLTVTMLAFDVDPYLSATTALEQLVPFRFRPGRPVYATPCREILRKATSFIQQHGLMRRVGIRVRVTESPADGRKPCRVQRDLNHTIRSIIRLPWYIRVFLVTDSQYIQQMLASHFHDARFLPKNFNEKHKAGYYVDRRDRLAMRTFLTEVSCLTACSRIINVGGFINEEFLYPKMISPPYNHIEGGQ